MKTSDMQIYAHIADLLDYPGPELIAQALACANLLAKDHPEAADLMQDFAAAVDSTPLGRMEEIYTGTFDVNPTCYIFAGYMLFGESFNRGKFLVRLQEEYQKRGFSMENELADHLAVMFRFFSLLDPDEILAQELVEDCFIPVLTTMHDSFANKSKSSNPYRHLLQAILMTLEAEPILTKPLPEVSAAPAGL